MVENEYEKIEQKLKEFLGIESGELREKIIEKAVCLDKDYSRMVVLRIYPDGTYDVGIGQEGNYDGLSSEERLWVEFSLIEPWDVYGFEDVVYDSDEGLYVDQSSGEKFTEEDLLEEVLMDAINGWCGKFEDEFNRFLIEFNNFLDLLKGDRDE